MREDDYKRKLVDYFKKNLAKGYTQESLRWALINQGYIRPAIEQSLKQANKELAEKAPILKEKPIINYELVDGNNNPIYIKKSWWRRLLGL